jgi:hypothetical protein
VFSPANVIFAAAGVLLSVAIFLDPPAPSDLTPIQAAKGVIWSLDALIIILEQIENFFKRLEEYAEVPMTEAMKEIMVKIMVEVLGIFAIMTKEIKHGRSSASIPNDTFPIADRGSEMRLEKIFDKFNWKEGYQGRAEWTGWIDAGGR